MSLVLYMINSDYGHKVDKTTGVNKIKYRYSVCLFIHMSLGNVKLLFRITFFEYPNM